MLLDSIGCLMSAAEFMLLAVTVLNIISDYPHQLSTSTVMYLLPESNIELLI